MFHHTKTKGDCGVGFIICDLLSKGISVSLPISEHQPYDLIMSETTCLRVQVKYRSLDASGKIVIKLNSIWSDKSGVHRKIIDTSNLDAVAIYCPNTKECYYVHITEFKNGMFVLRCVESKNNQKKNVNPAHLYINPMRILNRMEIK